MKKFTLFSIVAIFAMALVGCSPAANTNTTANVKTNSMNANSNVAVVVPSNSNAAANTGATNTMNSNITRADYDKDKDRYAKEAKDAGSNIGSGINDGWLWTKTRAALATTADLRDSTINVDVANDVVTLRGTVGSEAQKKSAETVAKGIEGVKSVTNQLKVAAGDSVANRMTSDGDKNANKSANANIRR